ncbi:DUF2798 domain-containing protein [Myroides odoratus]|uniref:DUF2798 domain-containing protein n=1 Tax=Myroides odoratus TaxID=256 RepID=UPI0039AEDE28
MDKKYYKYINTLFVVAPMTFAMSVVALFRTYGFEGDWPIVFLKSWLTMLPVAYMAAFIILPIAKKMTEKIVD